MYLVLIVISIIFLFAISWKVALPILIIVFALDRIIDNNRKEFEAKMKNKK